MAVIVSPQNSLLKRIRKLKQRKYRDREGAFWVEGIRGFLAAVENDAGIDVVLFCSQLLHSDRCYQAIDALAADGVRVAETTPDLFRKVADQENPLGIGAIVPKPNTQLAEMSVEASSLFVALVDAADPGNVGTILRSMDGMGGSGLILCGASTDLGHPKLIKASMGGAFSVPATAIPDLNQLFGWAKRHDIQIIATSAKANESFWETDYSMPILLLMGGERHGLPDETLAQADIAVGIPMSGSVSSLNLGVATSLLLYEIKRRGGVR